jgi:hypothetical protein
MKQAEPTSSVPNTAKVAPVPKAPKEPISKEKVLRITLYTMALVAAGCIIFAIVLIFLRSAWRSSVGAWQTAPVATVAPVAPVAPSAFAPYTQPM